MLQAGAVVADHLRLVRQLGSGGMGSVWVAEQTRLGGLVAVKFLSTALLDHESARSRFDREARLAAKIKSQHVVQVHDHGVTKTEPAIPYIVMELLEGTDLSKVLDSEGPLGLQRASEIVTQVCDALTKAHDAGIVHRDIKPENVFVLNETRTFVKLLDFGVAHGKDGFLDRLTQTGLLLGTAHYMSPEQLFSGKDIDLRADLWALGILTYQMLTNEVPFQAETFGQLCLQVRDGAFPTVSSKVNVPASVDVWFDRALSTDRNQRYQSATEMAVAFQRAISGESPTTASGSLGSGQVTGTGTVKVDKAEILRLKEQAQGAVNAPPTGSDAKSSPHTQRFGSHAEATSNSRPRSIEESFVRRETLPSGEHSAFSPANSMDEADGGAVTSNTPLAELSGTFGTEAKGVVALPARNHESGRGARKWVGWGLAAVVVAGAILYLAGAGAPDNLTDTAAASNSALTVDRNGPNAVVADVVRTTADPQAGNRGPASGNGEGTRGASDAIPVPGVSATAPTPENAELAGNQPSKGDKNTVTGQQGPTAPANPGSSAPRGPKTSGAGKAPKSSDHAPSDNLQAPVPAPSPSPAPKPESGAQRKPKYRGF